MMKRDRIQEGLICVLTCVDRDFGLIHVRLQTWLPMQIQICLNGREYLARRLDRAGIRYEKRDNCFVWIDNIAKAQQMLGDLERRNWQHFLSRYAHRLNPWCRPGNSLGVYDYDKLISQLSLYEQKFVQKTSFCTIAMQRILGWVLTGTRRITSVPTACGIRSVAV
ncbi:MAG: hypothetical protein V3R99_06100, partial [Thermoguttaceae bacterium]